jgi:uncharacterized cupin superfamily protein
MTRCFLLVLLSLAAACAQPDSLELAQASVLKSDLGPGQIPAHWIREGKPVAHLSELMRARDGGLWVGLWECSAGVFEWHFGSDELVQVLEGELYVRLEGGPERALKPGDVTYFNAGDNTVWRVPRRVKNFVALRDNREPLGRRIARKLATWF